MIAAQSEKPQIQEVEFMLGLADVKLLAVSPSAEELAHPSVAIITTDKVAEMKTKIKPYYNQQEQKYRLEFVLEVLEEGLPVRKFVKQPIFVKDAFMDKSKNGSVCVIDAKQRVGWISESDFVAEKNQVSSKGNTWLESPYRRAKEGEDKLLPFLRTIAGVYADESIVEPDIAQIVQGNLNSLQKSIAGGEGKKNSFFKVLLGVQRMDDGKFYQVVWRDAYPLWRFATSDPCGRIRTDVLDFLQRTEKCYTYGISPDVYKRSNLGFRLAKKSEIEAMLDNIPAQSFATPNPAASMPDIDQILGSTPITPLRGSTPMPRSNEEDDDLPF